MISPAIFPQFQAAASHRGAQSKTDADQRDEAIRLRAMEFESLFLADFLNHAGLEKALSGESGIGGEAFSSFLVELYAEKLVAKGGIGLADQIYNQLREKQS